MFRNILASTLSAFPHSQQRETKVPYKPINGIFALTPDSMPMAGPVSKIPGLYIAAAVWTTHAAGVGRLMADIVSGKELSVEDEVLRRAFDPLRYEGLDASSLRERALGTYNDIYNKDRH
jgi:glycine/D-amino acid oxidase-like deaminating enzyme